MGPLDTVGYLKNLVTEAKDWVPRLYAKQISDLESAIDMYQRSVPYN